MLRRSIVVPLYQESGRIAGTVQRLAESVLNEPSTEFVFVDDGSTDATVEVLEAALRGTGLAARVLTLPGNRGKGAAVRTGVLAARADVVAFVDADLSSPPSAILQCLVAVEAGADVAVGSRGHATSDIVVRQPVAREAAGKTFNLLVRVLGLTDLPDTQCGLKAFRRDVALALFQPLTIRRFAFDVEVLARANQRGFHVQVLPTEWAHVEQSRVSPVRDGARMEWDAVRVAWVLRRDAPGRAVSASPETPAQTCGRAGTRSPAGAGAWVRSTLSAQVRGQRQLAIEVDGVDEEVLSALHAEGFDLVVGTAVRRARRPLEQGVHCVVAAADALPLPTGSTDVLVCGRFLRGHDADMRVLAEYHRVVRGGGVALLTVPAGSAWRVPRSLRYSRQQLEEALTAAGFREVEVRVAAHVWWRRSFYAVARRPS